ncbi:MAG: hypothetical protein CM1200mP20_02810 [Pseudomonadota bacterium]|nr:MAG: hypothetical protein CM1200mP20_02810 [Pseudomonadota bacterium]
MQSQQRWQPRTRTWFCVTCDVRHADGDDGNLQRLRNTAVAITWVVPEQCRSRLAYSTSSCLRSRQPRQPISRIHRTLPNLPAPELQGDSYYGTWQSGKCLEECSESQPVGYTSSDRRADCQARLRTAFSGLSSRRLGSGAEITTDERLNILRSARAAVDVPGALSPRRSLPKFIMGNGVPSRAHRPAPNRRRPGPI